MKIDSVKDVSEEGLLAVGNDMLNRSLEIVPVETGALKKSAFIETDKTPGRISVSFGYNKDGSAPYAVFAHEIGPYKKPTTSGTQYKFLSTAIVDRLPMVVPLLRASISRALRKK